MTTPNQDQGLSSPESLPSEYTKKYLASLAQETAQKGSFSPAMPEMGVECMYYAPISGDELEGTMVWLPDGTAEDPALRGNIALERVSDIGLIQEYRIRKTPDGWDVEKHIRIIQSHSLPNPDTATQTSQEVWDEIHTHDAKVVTRRRDEQMARELGLTTISEGEAREIINLLKKQ